jgi:uncharacterized protein (TIGR03000 family)
MRQAVPVLACCLFLTPSSRAGDIILPDGTPLSGNGGLIIMRRGDQTTVSFGGVFLPRKVRVSTETPEGPVVTRFTMPALTRSQANPPFPPPPTSPALVRVSIPDPYGIVYIEDKLVRTKSADRLFESPPLPLGKVYPLRLSAVFQVDDRIFVEKKTVMLKAGESSVVTFDGSQGVSVAAPTSMTK